MKEEGGPALATGLDIPDKFLDCESGRSNQTAERPSRDFLVIWDRERGPRSFLNEDDVTGALPNVLPAECFKYTDDFASAH
jgi:hypothetical protein